MVSSISWPAREWFGLGDRGGQVASFDKKVRAFLTNSEVWRNLALPAVNTVFLAGKAIHQFPPTVTNLAYSALKFIGVLTLDVQIGVLIKTIKDFVVALVHSCWMTMMYTASGIFVNGSSVLLTLAGAGAALATTLYNGVVAAQLFQLMRPWGLASLAVMVLMDIYSDFADRHVIAEMDKLLKDPRRNDRMRTILEVYTGNPIEPEKDHNLAVMIRSRVDKDTWYEFQAKAEKLAQERPWDVMSSLTHGVRTRKLFTAIRDNILTNHTGSRANLGLTALGYVAMGITRANPNTLTEAVTNLGMSTLYTSKFMWQKFNQISQQIEIGKVT